MPWPAVVLDQQSNTVAVIHGVNYDHATSGTTVSNNLTRQRRPGLADNTHDLSSNPDQHYLRCDRGNNFTSLAAGAIASYRFVVESSDTFYFWIRFRCQSNDPDVYWGVDGTQEGSASSTTQGADVWQSLGSKSISVPGRHALNIGPRRDDTMWNQIVITTDNNYTPSGFLSAVSGWRDSGNEADDHRCTGDWIDPNGHHDFQNSPTTTDSGIMLPNGYDGFGL